MECKSFVGLFPEIHRAFITIDNKLFLWNYYDGSDFYLYDELSQIIISVALLRPKAGVFVESIQHILVVSTPIEILMFAVKFDDDNYHNSLQLFPTQFTIPSDNVHMTSIIGTDEGRIFLLGRDGGVYELDYWSADDGGWFGAGSSGASTGSSILTGAPFTSLFTSHRKKCRKVNHSSPSSLRTNFKLLRSILPGFLGGPSTTGVIASEPHVESLVYDSTRNFLYTLMNETIGGVGGGIRPILVVYELGPDGKEMHLRARLDDIIGSTKTALRQLTPDLWSDIPSELKLVHLSPIPVHESPSVLLLAVTSHGHRLYFAIDSKTDRLYVKFVRLCPPAINSDEIHRGGSTSMSVRAIGRVEPRYAKGTSPSLVHSAYYKDGILLLADAGRSALGDSLVSIHRDPRPSSSSGASSTNARSWLGFGGGFGSHPIAQPAQLNEAIDSFDFDARIADVGEVDLASILTPLSSALFARSRSAAPNGYDNSTRLYPVVSATRSPTKLKPMYGLPELATQHLTPNRQLLILTSTALLTMSKIRPLDELRHALTLKKRTNDDQPLNAFFQRYGAKESCAMCLIIIGASYSSGSSLPSGLTSDEDVERRGGSGVTSSQHTLSIASPNKLLATTSTANMGGVSEDQIRKGAKQAFFRFGEMASASYPQQTAASKLGASPKLEAIALYLARWIRAHWDWSLCVPSTVIDGTGTVTSISFRWGREFYVELLQPLVKLQRFCEEHQRLLVRDFNVGANGSGVGMTPSTSTSAAAYGSTSSGSGSGLADPARLECEHFLALTTLLDLIVEVLNLLILFLGSHVGPYYSSSASGVGGVPSELETASVLLRSSAFLTPTDLQALKEMKFYDLVTNSDGHALIRKLINTLASVGAGSTMTTNNLSSPLADGTTSSSVTGKRTREMDGQTAKNQLIAQLHTACPTFFGSSDLLYYNALDSLKHARQHWNLVADRTSHIQRALQTYHSFLASASFPLEDVADKLKSVYEYSGIVELAMRRAELLERREITRPKLVGAGGFTGGVQQAEAEWYATQRKRCFHVILDTMNILMFGVVAGKSLAAATNGSSSSASSSSSGGSDRSSAGLGSMMLASTDASTAAIPALSPEQLSASRDHVLAQILASNDAPLHEALYRWYIEMNLLDDLYTIQSDHLIRFLTSSEEYILILKDYYLRNERWHEVSLLLNYLSLKRGTAYSLRDRTDYLTLALSCARNFQQQLQKHGGGVGMNGSFASPMTRLGAVGVKRTLPSQTQLATTVSEQQDFIDQLKDRIEIAKIQTEIYGKLELVRKEVGYTEEEEKR